ncbi:MAG: hypothetical protein WC091_11775 [Sulfuricellaceae bacterium]
MPKNIEEIRFVFCAEGIGALFEKYRLLVLSILENSAIGAADVVISEHAFSSALLESSKDLQMLTTRRLPNGVSEGKVAGVFAFRLSRWNVISLPERLANERAAMQLNYLAALAFSYNFLGLDIRKIDNTIRVEIQYNLVRRHSNQETLGLCFDMLLKCKAFH